LGPTPQKLVICTGGGKKKNGGGEGQMSSELGRNHEVFVEKHYRIWGGGPGVKPVVTKKMGGKRGSSLKIKERLEVTSSRLTQKYNHPGKRGDGGGTGGKNKANPSLRFGQSLLWGKQLESTNGGAILGRGEIIGTVQIGERTS